MHQSTWRSPFPSPGNPLKLQPWSARKVHLFVVGCGFVVFVQLQWMATTNAPSAPLIAPPTITSDQPSISYETEWKRLGSDSVAVARADPAANGRIPEKSTLWSSLPLHRLRLDWTDLALSSPFARAIRDHQSDCSLPLGDFRFRNRFGLGSDLHVWTQAQCNGMQDGFRIRTEHPWVFRDETSCPPPAASSDGPSGDPTALLCYFPHSELLCPADRPILLRDGAGSSGNRTRLYRGNGLVSKGCERVRERFNLSFSDVRAAGIEYLFSRTGPVVVKEAQRQLEQLFGQDPSALPSRLITVHIRWGDKKKEMRLRPVHEYVKAVVDLAQSSPADGTSSESSIGVFLATEDPQAVREFRQAARAHNWTVYVDAYFREFESDRDPTYNGNPRMSHKLRGRPGLVALASLLVALQSDDFVLTTSSNWSRLINELRKNVLDPRCNNCTRIVDLSPGEW